MFGLGLSWQPRVGELSREIFRSYARLLHRNKLLHISHAKAGTPTQTLNFPCHDDRPIRAGNACRGASRHHASSNPAHQSQTTETLDKEHQADSRVPILCRYSIKISDTLNADRRGEKHPDCLQGPPSLTSRICCPQPWPICGVGKSRSRPDNKIGLKNDRGKARKSADVRPVAEIRAGELRTTRVTKPPRSRQPEGLLTYMYMYPPVFHHLQRYSS